MSRKHHYHSPFRRGLYSTILIVSVMTMGTLGIHFIEGLSYIDAFYFMSMMATAQGPTYVPQTVLGKLFASFISFVSVGCVVASLGFFFGPFLGKLWRIGVIKLEEELHLLNKDKEK